MPGSEPAHPSVTPRRRPRPHGVGVVGRGGPALRLKRVVGAVRRHVAGGVGLLEAGVEGDGALALLGLDVAAQVEFESKVCRRFIIF